MKGVTIYMEGGGSGPAGKAALRQGMDAFLRQVKDAARRKAIRWKLVVCGSQQETYRRFEHAAQQAGRNEESILLMDADTPVTGLPRAHLLAQHGWDLSFAPEVAVHLMVRVMETWIVADSEALAEYYGRGFKPARLPNRHDLEQEPKQRIEEALKGATRRTKKQSYHKIRDASALLKRIDPTKVKVRCGHCKRLFEELGRLVEAA